MTFYFLGVKHNSSRAAASVAVTVGTVCDNCVLFLARRNGQCLGWGSGSSSLTGQTHSNGESVSDLSRCVTLSSWESLKKFMGSTNLIFEALHSMFEDVCVVHASVFFQECYSGGRALHRVSSVQTLTGPPG